MVLCCGCCCQKSRVEDEDAIDHSKPLLNNEEGMVGTTTADGGAKESKTNNVKEEKKAEATTFGNGKKTGAWGLEPVPEENEERMEATVTTALSVQDSVTKLKGAVESTGDITKQTESSNAEKENVSNANGPTTPLEPLATKEEEEEKRTDGTGKETQGNVSNGDPGLDTEQQTGADDNKSETKP